MDMLKAVLKQQYSLVILLGSVLFVIGVYVLVPGYSANIYASMSEENVKTDGMEYLEETVFFPQITYQAVSHTVGGKVKFGELFLIEPKESCVLYLKDIRNKNGDSVLVTLSTDEIINMEEIPASFVYDVEEDVLYFYASGVYTMYIKACGTNGEQEWYEVVIPVETA